MLLLVMPLGGHIFPRARLSMLAVLVVACRGGGAGPDGGADAPAHDDGLAVEHGGAPDAVVPVADARAPDAGSTPCAEWASSVEWNPALCTSAAVIEPPAALTMQDTATGGYGDCAKYASGGGGPNLYYSLTIPAGKVARVIAAPVMHTEDALIRVLPGCSVTMAEGGARGGTSTDGRATGCVMNDEPVERTVVIAVGRYSGEAQMLTLAFDLSVQIVDSQDACCCKP